MNFLALDFETASSQPHSACSIALTMVRENKIVGEFSTLIKPDTPFSPHTINVHHITPDMVQDAPTFSQVWPVIEQYFNPNSLIVAHNAAFDNRVLSACLAYSGFAQPTYLTLDTVRTSRACYKSLPNHKLNTVADYLNISLNHHDALDDSRACALILIHQATHFDLSLLKPFVSYYPK